jgi:hypothetical protein
MALLAITYPTIAATHYQWIQKIRRQHDTRYYHVVDPHFTLIFPTFDLEPLLLREHVRSQSQGQASIAISLCCAIVVKDQLSDYTQTFLVPDQGFGALVKLHDKLYTGILADQLRLDIPYIPHIGVATSLDSTLCKAVADEINSRNLTIPASIRLIDIVDYTNNTVTTLEQISLE